MLSALARSTGRNSLLLGLFALATAFVLAATYQLTERKIAREQRRAAARALAEIVPQARHNNDMLADVTKLAGKDAEALGLSGDVGIHIARQRGEVVALIYPCRAADGYSGDIDLIVGVNADGSVAGVRVLSHRETPGLGDKIDLRKSSWVRSFEGKSLGDPAAEKWRVRKDGGEFDQFTGATITPRAVVRRVRQTLEFHRTFFPRLLAAQEQERDNEQ